MAHGSARRNWCLGGILGAAILAGTGCTGKDKTETGLRSLDAKTKAALIGPPSKDLPKPKFAMTDPNATGGKDISVAEKFDRKMPNNAMLPSGLPVNGSLASSTVLPTQPTTGGQLMPQKSLEQVKYEAPPVVPLDGPLPKPVMPLDNPTPTEPPAPTLPLTQTPTAAPFPPPAPAGAMIIPDAGLVPLPSATEKEITGFPVVPTIVK